MDVGRGKAYEAIENRVQELVTLTKGSYQDIKNVTSNSRNITTFDISL